MGMTRRGLLQNLSIAAALPLVSLSVRPERMERIFIPTGTPTLIGQFGKEDIEEIRSGLNGLGHRGGLYNFPLVSVGRRRS